MKLTVLETKLLHALQKLTREFEADVIIQRMLLATQERLRKRGKR